MMRYVNATLVATLSSSFDHVKNESTKTLLKLRDGGYIKWRLKTARFRTRG